MATHSSILLGESRGQRSLVGSSHEGPDMSERLSTHAHISVSSLSALEEVGLCPHLERRA